MVDRRPLGPETPGYTLRYHRTARTSLAFCALLATAVLLQSGAMTASSAGQTRHVVAATRTGVRVPSVAPVAPPLTTRGVGTAEQATVSVRPVGGTLFLVGAGGADVTYVATPAGYFYVDEFGGGLQFYPRDGFSGTAPTVHYIITNAATESATNAYIATVTKPAPPTAAPLSSTRSGGPYYQYADTSDISGNPMAFFVSGSTQVTSLTMPGKGTYYVTSGDGISLSFQATNCFVGTVPTVTYRLIDQYEQHADSTYTAHVTNPSPPTVSPLTSTGTGPARQTVTAPQPGCIGSTKLLDGNGHPVTTLTRSDGTYTVVPATGVITFSPAPGDSGTGATVAYRVTDQFGQHADSTYTTSVTPPAPPTASPLTSTGVGPSAQHVTVAVPADGHAMLLDGVHPVTKLTVAGQGAYSIATATGVITFTPEAGYLGTGTPVSYTVTDSYDQSATSTFTATVTEPAAPNPAALTSTATGTAIQSRTISIPDAGSVTMLDGSTPVALLVIAGEGNYALDPATGLIQFAPVNGYTGTATPVRYEVTDSYGQTGASTYTPTVTIPGPPSATPLKSSGTAGTSQQRKVAIPPGGAVTLIDDNKPVTTVTDPGQGTYSLDAATGVITFVPLAGFFGKPAPVTYRVGDAYGQSVRSTYSPTVTAAIVSPTTAPATTAVNPTPTAAPGPTTAAVPAASGSLPNTGSDVALLTQIALLLILFGAALTASTRYRRRPRFSQHR